MIIPNCHCPARPQVTVVDGRFGTHTYAVMGTGGITRTDAVVMLACDRLPLEVIVT